MDPTLVSGSICLIARPFQKALDHRLLGENFF